MEKFESEFPRKQKAFIGREEHLNKINALFKSKQIMAISAFGGTGKSSLALEYCHRLIEKNPNYKIRWFDAAILELLEDEFTSLADLFDINIENYRFDFILRKIYSKLEESSMDILFVFDNVESYDDIKEYLRLAPSNIKLLLTTRDNLDGLKVDKIELEPFNLEETVQFIQKNIDSGIEWNENDRNKIINLAKSTNNEILPIKIELIVSYLNVYMENKPLEELMNSIVNHQYLYDKIEMRLLANLKTENEQAFGLLRICSLLNPDYAEKKLLFNLFNAYIHIEINKELTFKNALALLNKLSLVSNTTKNKVNGIKIHRLIQEELISFIENETKFDKDLDTNEKLLKVIINYVESEFGYPTHEPKTWKKTEELYHQTKNMSTLFSRKRIDFKANETFLKLLNKVLYYELISSKLRPESKVYMEIIEAELGSIRIWPSDFAKALINLGSAYLELNEPDKALEYQTQALEMLEKQYDNHQIPELANTLNNIGSTYTKLSKHGLALEYYLKALELYEILYNTDHSGLATCLNNIGATYDELNEHTKAFEYHTKSFEMLKRLHGATHPNLAKALQNLGSTCHNLNEHEKALEFYRNALAMNESLYEVEHVNLARSLSLIGFAYAKLNDFNKAVEFQLKALEMRQRLYEADHSDLAESLTNLGLGYAGLGDHKLSLEYYMKAFEMQERLWSRNEHPDLAKCLFNIGAAYNCLNDFKKALEYQIKGLDMQQRLLDADHPDLASSLNNIGFTYANLNDYKSALEIHMLAFDMQKKSYSGDHQNLAISLNNIGGVYKHLGDVRKALEYLTLALEMNQRLHSDEDHIDVAASLNNIGSIHFGLGKYEKALEYHLKGLEMQERLWATDHLGLVNSLNNIGLVYERLGDYKSALEYHDRAMSMSLRLNSEDNPDLARCLNNIGLVCSKLSNYKLAVGYFFRALEMQQRLYDFDHLEVVVSLNNIGLTYLKLKEHEKAIKYLLSSLEMRHRSFESGDKNLEIAIKKLRVKYERVKNPKKLSNIFIAFLLSIFCVFFDYFCYCLNGVFNK